MIKFAWKICINCGSLHGKSVSTMSFCSIAEYSVDNSLVKPTYMLTHESASELLNLNLKEEADLKLLSEAATLRLQWRCQQVGLNESD